MNTRHKHLLAYGIVEYNNSLDHFLALRSAGVHVPFSVTGRIEAEYRRLLYRWLMAHGEPRFTRELADSALVEAREWAHVHISEIDELLNDDEEGKDERAGNN